MRTAAVFAILLVVAGSRLAAATDVYWIPAHHLAPQGHSARFATADLDGDLDIDISMLLLGPVHQYWNVGTPQDPEWELDLTQFGEIISCSFRSGAFGDVDQDGDLDLLITCYSSDIEPPWFYWNVGTPHDPVWEADPSVVDSIVVSYGASEPYLADVDGDGDLDLLAVISSGWVKHFENVGGPTAPVWEHVGYLEGVTIGPGTEQTIAFGDVDRDGDLDLVGITWDSPPECWENVGTPQAYEFVENPSMLIGVDEPGEEGGQGIDLMDIDGDGDLDMLIAGGSLGNFLYLNEGFTPVEQTSWGTIKALFR
jgi:hypothetical protein